MPLEFKTRRSNAACRKKALVAAAAFGLFWTAAAVPLECGPQKAQTVIHLTRAEGALEDSPAPADPPFDANCRIRLGIGSFASPNPNYGIIAPTVRTIERAFPEEKVCTRRFTTPELEQAVRSGQLDLFISSAGFYRRVLDEGVRDIASVMGPHITNPNEAEGSIFVSLGSRSDLDTLESLEGTRLAANMPLGFTGFLAGMREIADTGADPERYFASVQFFGHDQSRVLDELLAGRADVGILRACTYEEVIDANPIYRKRFRVLNEKHHDGFTCKHSTRLYPSWVLAVTKSLSADRAARAAAAILNEPPAPGGLFWAIATDFTEVDALYKTLRLGPYEFLRQWSLVRFWETYQLYIVAALLIVLGLVVHGWRSEVLVKRRTAELRTSLEHERSLERRAADLRSRMQSLQKAGVVGQISSLIAHELGQPVGAVRLYARGLLRASENNRLTPESLEDGIRRIDREAERVQAILDRVRSYAKSKTARRKTIDADALVERAAKNFLITSRGQSVELLLRLSERKLYIHADPLEIELVVVNLLKNAADALRGSPLPQITLSTAADDEGQFWTVSVADNGPRLSKAVFEQLSRPTASMKSDGLGLGLSICRSIVELHGGGMVFARGANGLGLVVSVHLPLLAARPAQAAEEPS